MSTYEFFDDRGDAGMLVVGWAVDRTFRDEADKAGRPDERLLTVTNPEDLLTKDSLEMAARGLCNRPGGRQSTLADSNR